MFNFKLPAIPERLDSTGMSDVTRLLDAAAAGDRRPPPSCSRSSTTNCATSPPPGWPTRSRARRSRRPRSSTRRTSGWSGRTRRRTGTAAGTSSPPRPRPCAASWSSPPAARTSLKRGGDRDRAEFDLADLADPERPDEVLAVDEALAGLAAADPQAAELVKLRYFVGLSVPEAAATMSISTRSAERLWTYARAWLRRAIEGA